MLYKFIGMLKVPGKKTEAMRQAPASVKGHILLDGALVQWPSRVAVVGDGKKPKRDHHKAGFVACCCKCCCALQMCVFIVSNIAHVSKCFSVKLCFCICLLPQFHSGRFVSSNFEGLCQIFYPSVQHDAQNWLQRHE